MNFQMTDCFNGIIVVHLLVNIEHNNLGRRGGGGSLVLTEIE